MSVSANSQSLSGSVPVEATESMFPASFAQEGMWFAHQMDPESPRLNVPVAYRLRGPLHKSALQKSLITLMQRHKVLRSTLAKHGEAIVQVVAGLGSLSLAEIPLGHLPPQEREFEVTHILASEGNAPFDLERGPLFRARLLCLDREDHILQFTMHHSIMDGWSLHVFLEELAVLYNTYSRMASAASLLPAIPIQYADVAFWQRQRLRGKRLDDLLQYWRNQLAGAPALLRLPLDRPRPPRQTFCGKRWRFSLPGTLRESLSGVCQQEKVTLFMLLLAAFQTLLFRYTNQDEIVVGTPTANRIRVEQERLLGLFVNTLVLRSDLAGNPPFRALLGRVRKTCLDAFGHQELPFELLVQAMRPERDLSYHPLFQVMFVLHSIPPTPPALNDLQISPLEIDLSGTQFDLTLECSDGPDGIACRLEYSSDLFADETVQRLAGHFQRLLEGIAADPDQQVELLPLLTTDEQQLLRTWNGTQVPYAEHACIHHLFEEQATHTPDAPAIVYEQEQLTYRQLHTRSNKLAHYLQQLGVGPEKLVGICLERSLDMIVAVLGVLKAGGAYVPLDPTYPPARLAFIISDAQPTIILTHHHLQGIFPAHEGHTICLDSGWHAVATCSGERPESLVQADNLAYVLYTSGSTGQSKAVCIAHRGLCNLAHAERCLLHLTPSDRVLQYSSLNFDASVAEIIRALCSGASLYLASFEALLPGPTLLRLLRERAITTVMLPPSVLALLPVEDFPALTTLILGGEDCSSDLIQRWRRDGRRIFNAYGPTETTVWTCACECSGSTGHPPIGRPIGNTQVYILDRHLQPVPVGVVGEIYIGGVGVAREYLNRPELTAERFIPDFFSTTPGARLYKTGDMARYHRDGDIEYLGRVDRQVKLRGLRIEPGEIEAALCLHPAVLKAVVLLITYAATDTRLVAYVQAREEAASPPVGQLRDFLQARLPAYMLPSSFVFVHTWPLSQNGKLDTAALADLNQTAAAGTAAIEAPRTPAQAVLLRLWQEVLHTERLGISENFFELGGHSLLAAQLVARMSTALATEIPITLLFLHPTIAELAEALGEEVFNRTVLVRPVGWPEGVPEQSEPLQGSTGSAQTSAVDGGFTLFETRPLLPLFASGLLAPVDAVALAYLTEEDYPGISHEDVQHRLFQGLPLLTHILDTPWGRTALLTLPLYSQQLYSDPERLVHLCVQARTMARSIGARVLSLTGLLPSATEYGRALQDVSGGKSAPRISTGHATTTAAVVCAISRILRESGRELSRERVAILGLGSIGKASLRLMLRRLPHPEQLLLCDLYEKQAVLEEMRRELAGLLGFQGDLRCLVSHGRTVPDELYQASMIIGATNVPGVLNIGHVAPGMLIVDDSGPHCFELDQAIERLKTRGDLLFTEGGVLQSPWPITETIYLPAHIGQDGRRQLARSDPHHITGCVFSSLLSAHFEDLEPTLGPVDTAQAEQHLVQLEALGFQAADLHCDKFVLSEEQIRAFRRRFGQ